MSVNTYNYTTVVTTIHNSSLQKKKDLIKRIFEYSKANSILIQGKLLDLPLVDLCDFYLDLVKNEEREKVATRRLDSILGQDHSSATVPRPEPSELVREKRRQKRKNRRQRRQQKKTRAAASLSAPPILTFTALGKDASEEKFEKFIRETTNYGSLLDTLNELPAKSCLTPYDLNRYADSNLGREEISAEVAQNLLVNRPSFSPAKIVVTPQHTAPVRPPPRQLANRDLNSNWRK
jgi:hypothetical protein